MQIIVNQVKVVDFDLSVNSGNVIKSINENNRCHDFMIFPELCLTGFPEKHNIDELWEASGLHFKKILSASKNTHATIVIGHIEKYNQFFYNSCFFIKNSRILHIHRKSKLWCDDIDVFSIGDSHSIIDINGVTCGAQICFELEFPEGSRALSKQGVEIIFMPNGNMHPYGNIHYILTQARAIENQCFIITCNRVGSGYGGEFVGESLIVSPTGEIISKLGSNQEIATIAINLDEIKQSKNNYSYINLL